MSALIEWAETALPEGFADKWSRHFGASASLPHAYKRGELYALVSRDVIAHGDARWHISLRYGEPGENGRVPSWGELVECGHRLRPGVPFVVGVPPRSWWINVHPHVLHLWESKDKNLVEMWRAESRGDQPT